jgi:hypothetical protein
VARIVASALAMGDFGFPAMRGTPVLTDRETSRE